MSALEIANFFAATPSADGSKELEELRCAGLRPEQDLLEAVLTVKKSSGCSGCLCKAGSPEYVAFRMDLGDGMGFSYIGTSTVQVHDLVSIPKGEVQYAVFLKTNLGGHLAPCTAGPRVVRAGAILSREVPPPLTNTIAVKISELHRGVPQDCDAGGSFNLVCERELLATDDGDGGSVEDPLLRQRSTPASLALGYTQVSSPMRLFRRALVALTALVAVFLLLPSPIDPLGWDPPQPPPLSGALEPNARLAQAERLGEGELVGPEDAIVDGEGRVYGAAEDGRIVRLTREGASWKAETFAQTGGRPLGLQWDGAGNLVACDATRGLLSIDGAGKVTLLTDRAGDRPFKFTDDVDIASDGRIYFSDASSRWDKDTYLFDLLEARPWGRLLRYNPATGKTETLLKDLYFANGVALSQNEDFVLVNETYRYRITRYWLKGERAGTSDIFLDNLPGIADGISSNRRGRFWVAMFTPRNERADFYHRHPFLKRQLGKLPRAFWPKPQRYGFVVALDENGQATESLHDPSGERVPQVTSAWEHEGWLYLGTLTEPYLSRVRLR